VVSSGTQIQMVQSLASKSFIDPMFYGGVFGGGKGWLPFEVFFVLPCEPMHCTPTLLFMLIP